MNTKLYSFIYKLALAFLGLGFVVLLEATAQGALLFPIGAILLVAIAAAAYKMFMLVVKRNFKAFGNSV